MAKAKFNRIKTALTEADKQNSELAEFMNVHVTTVSDWCTNTNQPSIQDLFAISKFLKINVRKLLIPTNWTNDRDKEIDENSKERAVKPVGKNSIRTTRKRKQIKK
jgi:transcriptional regulator with XRE-family HTH domain